MSAFGLIIVITKGEREKDGEKGHSIATREREGGGKEVEIRDGPRV